MNGKLAKRLRRQARATAPDPFAPYGFRIQERPTPADKPKRLPAVLRSMSPKSARFAYEKLKDAHR